MGQEDAEHSSKALPLFSQSPVLSRFSRKVDIGGPGFLGAASLPGVPTSPPDSPPLPLPDRQHTCAASRVVSARIATIRLVELCLYGSLRLSFLHLIFAASLHLIERCLIYMIALSIVLTCSCLV